jgi:hypothetical protein
MNCTFADTVRLWNALRTHHQVVWLINKVGCMFTPQSLLEECALSALFRETVDRDTLPHNLAGETSNGFREPHS